MRDDDRIDIGEFVRGAERTAEERRRKRLATWRAKTSLLAPLLVIIGALAMYGDWETPYDRRLPSDDERDDVASFRASPLPSNPAALPALVQRDIEQLVEVDGATPSKRDLATRRTERRVTLLRAYAVLRYDEAGPLLEDVVDTTTDERLRAEAVTMLGYVGYPSWRLLDELVDARDEGRDLMPHLRALRYFFAMASEPPPWIRDAVRELVAIAEECPLLECRRAAAGAVERAVRTHLAGNWIDEIERLAQNPDHECRRRAIYSLRGATAAENPVRTIDLLRLATASREDDECQAAVSRLSDGSLRRAVGPEALARMAPSLRDVACNSDRRVDLRQSAIRALRYMGDVQSLLVVANSCGDVGDEAIAQARRVGDPIRVSDTEEAPARPDATALRNRISAILEDRRNDRTSNRDVVHGSRRSFAVDPLRRIAREIRREVLK